MTITISLQRLPSAARFHMLIASCLQQGISTSYYAPLPRPSRLSSAYARPQNSFRGEQCTRGAFARANGGGEGSGGVVADIAKLSVGREEYYTRELATDHEQYLSGHGESPGRWYGAGASSLGLEGEASVAGFQAMFEGRHPVTGEPTTRP
jgi:hypothetical protein